MLNILVLLGEKEKERIDSCGVEGAIAAQEILNSKNLRADILLPAIGGVVNVNWDILRCENFALAI